MGGLGFGLLEHPRQWPGAKWAGLYPGSGQSCQARPDEAREPTSGAAKGALWPCCCTVVYRKKSSVADGPPDPEPLSTTFAPVMLMQPQVLFSTSLRWNRPGGKNTMPPPAASAAWMAAATASRACR